MLFFKELIEYVIWVLRLGCCGIEMCNVNANSFFQVVVELQKADLAGSLTDLGMYKR